MFKKFKKNKVSLASKQPEPRSLDEINKDYAELCARAGESQYKVKIEQERLEQLNSALKNLNAEGAARQKLNSEAKASEAAPAPEESNA